MTHLAPCRNLRQGAATMNDRPPAESDLTATARTLAAAAIDAIETAVAAYRRAEAAQVGDLDPDHPLLKVDDLFNEATRRLAERHLPIDADELDFAALLA